MKKLSSTILLICLCTSFAWAHQPNKAFFVFNVEKNKILVEAQFPWSIRNALLDFDPSLEHATTSADFKTSFENYIEQNLLLCDEKGNPFSLKSIQEVDKGGHSHQSDYVFVFEGSHLLEVQNTLLFNIYDNQKNYHQFLIDEKKATFKTQAESKSFQLNESSSSSYSYWFLLCIPFFLLSRTFIRNRNT